METAPAAALLLRAPGWLEWTHETLPPPGPGQVLVRTLAGAVSVGTELPLFTGRARRGAAPEYPLMTGYESLARVVQVGEDVDRDLLGKRVVATYGHRTAALLGAATLIPVPDDVPDEIALLAVLSNDASRGVGKLSLGASSEVLITGAGTLGLLALHRLRWLGVNAVDMVEPLPARRALALRLGARAALAPDEPPAAPYDAGIECSARAPAFSLLQGAVRHGARLCVLSDGNVEPLVLEPHVHERELTIVASSDGEDYPGHAAAFWAHWRGTKAPLETLFEWRVTAAELLEAFERAAAGSPPVKVFVSYEG